MKSQEIINYLVPNPLDLKIFQDSIEKNPCSEVITAQIRIRTDLRSSRYRSTTA